MNRRAFLSRGVLLFVVLVVLALSAGYATPRTRWRLQLVVDKLAGRFPDLSWTEIAGFVSHKRALLGDLPETHNPYVSLLNPFTDPADVTAGEEVFESRCSKCHGPRGEGGSGPTLSGNLEHGGSDWALYRTITRGIPGTSMQPTNISTQSGWQLVSYIRHLASSEPDPTASNSAHQSAVDLKFEDLMTADAGSEGWPTYSGSYSGQRHSRLSEINRANVSRLRVKWMFQFPRFMRYVQATPLVVGDMMFVTLPPNEVYALDARTGKQLWSYTGPQRPNLRVTGNGGAVNRGVAILGKTVFFGSADAHLVALNAQDGRVLWDVKVAENSDGYFITGAPLAIRDKIVLGVAGGEFAARGFVDAYSPVDGKRLWRFYTIPAPGEPGNETWATPDAWKKGGAPTWLTGSYDPELDLLYWGVGNPCPDFQGDVRKGSNLYSDSVIAIEGATGRLRWYYQFTPHDEHDWDSVQIPILADAPFGGEPRKLVYWANRNGFYYVLDRVTGQFLHAKAFVKQTWASGFDSQNQPMEIPEARPTKQGTLAYPSLVGGTNWWSPTFERSSNTVFVPTMDGPGLFFKSMELVLPTGEVDASHATAVPGQPPRTSIRALDATTGDLRWQYTFPPRESSYVMGGLLSTEGGLVFGGDQSGFLALDSATGEELWKFNIGTWITAAPITYLSEGRQSVALSSGRTVVAFSLDGR
jgi:alcohol dehydrogenase (cytochrome c)